MYSLVLCVLVAVLLLQTTCAHWIGGFGYGRPVVVGGFGGFGGFGGYPGYYRGYGYGFGPLLPPPPPPPFFG